MEPESVATGILVGSRMVWFPATVLLIGIVTWQHRMRGLAAGDRSGRPGLVRAGVALAGLIFAVHIIRVGAETVSLFGLEGDAWRQDLRTVVFATPWGRGWRYQILATAAILGVLTLRSGRWRHALLLVLTAGLAVSTGATGHAVSRVAPPALGLVLQGVHVASAGVWIGTLAVLVVHGPALGPDRFVVALERFSPLALAGAGTLVVSGTASSVLYPDSWRQVFHGPWGRALLIKLVLVGIVIAIGAWHWRVARHRARTTGRSAPLLRTARIELGVSTAVLIVTAVLVGLPFE